MLATSMLPLRSAAAAALRPQMSTGLRTCLTSASYTTAARRAPQPSQLTHFPKRTACTPSITVRIPRSQFRRSSGDARVGPTTSSNAQASSNLSQTTDTTSARPSSSAAANSGNTLTWNRFLALRKTRRRIGLVTSVLSALAATAIGAQVVMAYDFDSIGAQTFGLDPLIVMGISVIASGGIGWLLGPAVGDTVFKVVYRKLVPQISQKEAEFFRRIKKFRVDPTSSSLNNPVPDYYGEKIGSVGDYRRWLKDQRAFNLKTSGRTRGAAAGRVALNKKGF